MAAAQSAPAAPAPAVGGGFAAPAGGGVEEKGKEEKIKEPSGLPGHGGPTGPIDKLHGGIYLLFKLLTVFRIVRSFFSFLPKHFS